MASKIGTRGSIVGTSPGLNDCASATVFPGDIMGSYGDFTSVENVSFWSLPYPVGWTNAFHYEQPAQWRQNGGCFCQDCHARYDANLRGQNYPDALVPCTNSIFSGDYWDYAINPRRSLAPSPCCSIECGVSSGCSSTPCVGYGSPGTNRDCRTNTACITGDVSGNWPLAPFGFSGSSRIRVVADATGPAGCLEDFPAMEVDLAGHDGGATYVGPGGGFGSTGFDPDNEQRSNTGWTITHGDCWTIDFWFKSVPDADGYDMSGSGARIRALWGLYPFQFGPAIHNGAAFDGTWQHFSFDANIQFPNLANSPLLNAVLAIQADNVDACVADCEGAGYSRPFYCRRGRFHVKAVHVYPCDFSSGAWFKRPSGLRT